jgi:hypothetical protein
MAKFLIDPATNAQIPVAQLQDALESGDEFVTNGLRLYKRDPETNAHIPVVHLQNGLESGDELVTRGLRLYKKDPETNALIPVVFSSNGGAEKYSSGEFTGGTVHLIYKNEDNFVQEYNSDEYVLTFSELIDGVTVDNNGTTSPTLNVNQSLIEESAEPYNLKITLNKEGESDRETDLYLFVIGTAPTTQYDIVYSDWDALTLTRGNTEPVFLTDYGLLTLSNSVQISPSQIVQVGIGRSKIQIGQNFLHFAKNFNQPFKIPDNLYYIGNNFLRYCTLFNQKITLPSIVNYIGNEFLSYCVSFRQPVVLPTVPLTIGTYFLRDCRGYDQPITFPNTVTIGNNFLYQCTRFNSPVKFSAATTIGSYFMSGCTLFNQDIVAHISSGTTYFISSSHGFNSNIEFVMYTSAFPANFLSGNYSFNRPVKLPDGIISIGNYFISNDYAFNHPVIIPNSVTSIGGQFLGNNWAFNSPVTLPDSLNSIGDNFLYSCESFNKPLTIPGSVQSIGPGFMSQCICFNQILTVLNDTMTAGNATTEAGTGATILKCSNAAYFNNRKGIRISGPGAQHLKDICPDPTNGIRKLIVV